MALLCSTQSTASIEDIELKDVISKGSLDFDEWISLISDIEKTYPDDTEKICLVYDNFLSEFPLCYGYWRKYAAHMTHLCTIDKVVEIFEQAVSAATYSVGMWVDYCTFAISAFEDPSDIRRLFQRAISFVGKDYLCHTLWDKYILFEFSQQQWMPLAHIYIQTLKFPTKKLQQYYDSFIKLVTLFEEGIASLDNSPKELKSEPCFDGEIRTCCNDDKIYCIIKDMMDSSVGSTRSIALDKYRMIGEQLYLNACELDSKISPFEANIGRYYFHVRPLDAHQLQNWHDYLDFIELEEDFDWTVKLYERCLVVCANYPEFWMRYVDFMETKGGREIANYSLNRATEIYLKRMPAIHLFNARFKEQIGDVLAARAAYIQSGKETDSDFVENVISKANMERRLGDIGSALNIYKEALEVAALGKKLHALPILYIHFFRLKYMSTNSVDAARDVLVDGIRNLPQNKVLLEELIRFSMVHGGPMHVAEIDSIVADAVSPRLDGPQRLSAKDAEDISKLYLEFVDYCGTIHDVRKAWNRHMKLFPYSARTDLHLQSNKCRISLNLIKDKRREISDAIPNQPLYDSSSDLQVHLTSQDKKVASQKYCDTQTDYANDGMMLKVNRSSQSNDTVMHRLQIIESDDRAEDKGREAPLQVSEEPGDNDPENNVLSAELVEVKEESSVAAKHLKKCCSESNVSSENLLYQTSSGNQSSQAFQASSKENDTYYQGKCEVKPEESLKPQESTCPDSVPMMSVECDRIPESCKSNSRAIAGGHTANQDNSESTLDYESARIHVETNSPSSAGRQDYGARRPHLQPRYSRNSSGNGHQVRNAGKFRRGPKYGHHRYPHRKPHQRQQLPSQQFHPAEGGTQMPVTPAYPSLSALQVQQYSQGQNQFQATATPTDYMAAHSWPIQNIQIQNSLSQSQPPSENTTSRVLQNSMQGNGQYGFVQNSEEYNQIWQYYYYQQQQQLQLQQNYIHLQDQPIQQEQSQQLQHQSQMGDLQPQQLQQLQLQYQVPQQQQQEHHPVYLQQQQPSTQNSSHPITDQGQGQTVVTSQGHGAILWPQSSKSGLVSSPVPSHPQEEPTQELE
ncbi:hypothetical protein Lal_00050182 [Lupinus albus]|uniref:Putative tetratricopeptide-like helical domain-containing protein n=1 Tax=Lupinus albus TaxID=3870 RepID=A0A6A5M453_LUPAL|nr:putative tetratricopeptide-like helical domain-containing protein [Lupinus albus]KAF1867749.1 hypothetical protein Lal_00050182 [Lupinus albus]